MRFQYRHCPYGFSAFAITVLVSTSLCPSHAQTDPKVMEELQVIAAHNKASYDRIRSFAVKAKLTNTAYFDPATMPIPNSLPKGTKRSVTEGSWFWENGKHRLDYVTTDTIEGTNTSDVSRPSYILANEYYAYIAGKTPNSVMQVEIDSINAMSEQVKKRVEFNWIGDPRGFGFTDGWQNFLIDMLSRHVDVLVWSIDQEVTGNETIYRISKENPKIKKKAPMRNVFWVDPARDFLITKVEHYDENGDLAYSLTVELQWIEAAKLWFPKRAESNFGGMAVKYEVLDASVNIDIDDNLFSIDSWVLDPRLASLKRLDKNLRKVGQYKLVDDQWVPEELVGQP
ncbi:MAG: hypothetical protein AMXMBFR84_40400 [Candidatus Hydrogenedentota bacterium]